VTAVRGACAGRSALRYRSGARSSQNIERLLIVTAYNHCVPMLWQAAAIGAEFGSGQSGRAVAYRIRRFFCLLRSLRPIADWFMFHIPLDVSAQSVARERPLLPARSTVGHLHYFMRGTALASLETAGFEIVSDKLLFPNDLPNRRSLSCQHESSVDPHF
jgi:hypothetical protein